MQTILMPMDFSDHALYALKAAARIAKKLNASMELAHVHNLPSARLEEHQYYDKFYRELKTKANKRLDELIHLDFLKDNKLAILIFLFPPQADEVLRKMPFGIELL